MAIPIFRHFVNYVEEKNDNIRIYDENKMVMIGIQCEVQDLIDLHHQMRDLSKNNDSIPMVVPPSRFGESTDIRMAVRCYDGKTIDRFKDTWFFEFALSYNSRRKKWETKPFYATTIFKKFILNLISIVEGFLQTDFRPVLQLNKIFVSRSGDVIFSKYERRVQLIHTMKEEAEQAGLLLESLVQLKAGNSNTLNAEFKELSAWLLSTHFQHGLNDDVREQLVFWDQRIRIQYISQLFDEVDARPSQATDIYNLSGKAFKVDNETNWRRILVTNRHPVLCELVNIGDRYYINERRKGNYPIQFRSDMIGNKTPAHILCCGLARMRDGYFHDGTHEKKLLPLYKGTQLRDIHLQSMFQDVFPSHMIEFEKSKVLINFRAKGHVQNLLDRAYIENASSSVDEYLAT